MRKMIIKVTADERMYSRIKDIIGKYLCDESRMTVNGDLNEVIFLCYVARLHNLVRDLHFAEKMWDGKVKIEL